MAIILVKRLCGRDDYAMSASMPGDVCRLRLIFTALRFVVGLYPSDTSYTVGAMIGFVIMELESKQYLYLCIKEMRIIG